VTDFSVKILQELNALVLPLVVIAVILSVSGIRKGEPLRVIIGRWAIWLCVSAGMAILLHRMGASSKPMWATALFCLLMWMFVETVYNWLAIDAISRSGLPLFPTYRYNEGGNQWPADRKFIALRENLRKVGLRSVASAIGMLGSEDYLRCSVYQNEDATLRLNLTFLPRGGGSLSVFCAFSSMLENGFRVVTDNVFIPFGGFYPENMFLERFPLVRSVGRLMKIHEKRVAKAESTPLKWENDPVAEMNELQKEIEKLNVSLGFLVDPSKREEDGNISREGRYRLWTELWTLNYLGRSKHYC